MAVSGEAPTFLSDDTIPCEAKSCNPLWDAKEESEYEEEFALHWVQKSKALWKMR